MTRWRHKKRGSSYDEVGTARLQVADAGALRDMEEMVVYRGEDGQLWARPALEFHDGRFELLNEPGRATQRVFRRAVMDSEGGPQPVIQPNEVAALSDTELASYLSASTYDFDGIGGALREAVVRLLRRKS